MSKGAARTATFIRRGGIQGVPKLNYITPDEKRKQKRLPTLIVLLRRFRNEARQEAIVVENKVIIDELGSNRFCVVCAHRESWHTVGKSPKARILFWFRDDLWRCNECLFKTVASAKLAGIHPIEAPQIPAKFCATCGEPPGPHDSCRAAIYRILRRAEKMRIRTFVDSFARLKSEAGIP